jgi:hypothetical protein
MKQPISPSLGRSRCPPNSDGRMGKVIRFLLFLGGAFAAWCLWLTEVLWVKGWAGLVWLSGFNWSALPICALIVIMASYFVTAHTRWSKRMMFFGVGWVITVGAFAIARWAAFELFSGAGLGAAIFLLIAGLIVAMGLAISANRWLAPLHYWTGILVGVALLLVLPLSVATIRMFPAFNGSTDQIHSIKMGYPIFWTAVLVPLAMRLGRRGRARIDL